MVHDVHARMEFSKCLQTPKKGQKKRTGTQLLDRKWDVLKLYFPKTWMMKQRCPSSTCVYRELAVAEQC